MSTLTEDPYNPLLAQLEGATAMGAASSHLVLQSLVAQSANVLKGLMAENKRLKRELKESEREKTDVAAERSWKERQGDEYGSY